MGAQRLQSGADLGIGSHTARDGQQGEPGFGQGAAGLFDQNICDRALKTGAKVSAILLIKAALRGDHPITRP